MAQGATTVGDLAEISGVSSRTFYDLFPDKEACFLATLEALMQAAITYAAQRARERQRRWYHWNKRWPDLNF